MKLKILNPVAAFRLGIRAEEGEEYDASPAEAALGLSEGWAEKAKESPKPKEIEPDEEPKPAKRPVGRPRKA